MSEIFKTNEDKDKIDKTNEEELMKSRSKLMDLIKKPETVSKLLEWFGKEGKDKNGKSFYPNLNFYGIEPHTMLHEVKGAQTEQNLLPLIANQDKQRTEFVTFLVDRVKTGKDASVASVKAAMETGPDLVKMLSAIDEKFPITCTGLLKNFCVG